MADTIRYGTTTAQEGKDRYFEREADLPEAREFGPGLAIIGDTAALKISDGATWSAIGGGGSSSSDLVAQYPAITDLPTPSGKIGIRHALAENILSISNGTTESKVAMLNQDGDLIANIIPRTGTLAELQAIIGDQGEIASPTDVSGIFKFTGNGLPGGELIKQTGNSTAARKKLNVLSNAGALSVAASGFLQASSQSFGDFATNMYVVTGTSSPLYYTINGGIDWQKLPPITGNPTIRGLYIAGDRVFVSVLGGLYVCTPVTGSPGATWTQITSVDAAFANIYPIVWGFSDGAVMIGGYDSVAANLKFQYISSKTGTSAGAVETFPVAGSNLASISQTKIFNRVAGLTPRVVIVMPDVKTSLYYKNFNATTPAWTSIPLPDGVAAISDFNITNDVLVVQYLQGGVYKYATSKISWTAAGGVIFDTYKVLTFTTANQALILANESTIFLVDVAEKTVSISSDSGDSFTKILTENLLRVPATHTINSVCIHESGIIFRTGNTGSVFVVFVSNDGHVSISCNTIGALNSPNFFGLFRLTGSVFPWQQRVIAIEGDAVSKKSMSSTQQTAGNITVNGEAFPTAARSGMAITYATPQTAIDLVLPWQPSDMATFSIYFKAAVTTLTVKPALNDTTTVVNGVGANVSGGGATLTISNVAVNQMLRFTYFLTTNEWILV